MERIHAPAMIAVSAVILIFGGILSYAFLFNPDVGYSITGFVVISPDVPVDEEILLILEEKGEARVIVNLKPPVTGKGLSAARDISLASNPSHIRSQQDKVVGKAEKFVPRHKFSSVNAMSGTVDEEALEELRKNPDVERIYLDLEMQAFLNDSVPLINATRAWNVSFNGTLLDGSGVTVCVIDTGIDYTHEAFGNCSESEFLAGNCKKVLGGIDYVNDDDNPWDDNGHGTHVAGIVAADSSLKGVAPGAGLIAVKALNNEGSGWLSDVIKGVEWCTENKEVFNISVISMSLGSSNLRTSFCDNTNPSGALAINNAVNAGLSVVSATGNSNSVLGIAFPACIENSLRVAASNKNDDFASFSNRGPGFPDIIVAPGVSIYSALPGSNYDFESGTSMATPHVSGVIALLYHFEFLQGNSFNQSEALSVISGNGVSIFDSGTNMNFSRVDVFGPLVELDVSPPVINVFVNPSSGFPGVDVNVSWLVSDNVGLAYSGMNISGPGGSPIFNSSNFSGNISLVNISGLGYYNISFFSIDHKGLSSSLHSFFSVKSVPSFSLLLDGLEKNVSLFGPSVVNLTSVSFDNVSLELFVNNESVLSSANFSVNYSFDDYKEYNVSLVSAESDFFVNTEKSLSVNVINVTPSVNFHPVNASFSLLENESVLFYHNSSDYFNSSLNSSWLVNGLLAGNKTSFLFVASDHNVSLHNVSLFVSNNYSSSYASWLVSVEAVPPVIEFFNPENLSLTLRKNNSVLFNHSSFDVLNRSLNVSWLVNNSFVSGNDSYSFNSSFWETGFYNISLLVHNNFSSSNISWSLQVLPHRIPVSFNESNNIPGFAWEQGSSLANAFNLNNYFAFEDDASFELINSSNTAMLIDNFTVSFTSNPGFFGFELVRIFAYDGFGNASSNPFYLNISKKEVAPASTTSPSPSPSPSSPPPVVEEEIVVETEIFVSAGFNASVHDNVVRVESLDQDSFIERIEISSDASPGRGSISVSEVSIDELFEATQNLMNRKNYKAFTANTSLANASPERILVSFKVSVEWLSGNNVFPEEVVLLRHVNEWVELETSIVRNDDNYYYFEAISPGNSYFVVSTKEITVPEEETPGIVNETQEPVANEKKEFIVNVLSAVATIFLILIMFVLFNRFARSQALKKKKEFEEQKNKKQ